MTAAVPDRPVRPARPVLEPCLTLAPSAGPVISFLFVVAVLAFVIGLIAL